LGVANLHDPAECTSDTLYDIASSSKSLTAASVALLVQDDKNHPEVQWDTPLYDLLPEDFVMPTPELSEEDHDRGRAKPSDWNGTLSRSDERQANDHEMLTSLTDMTYPT
jgi:CubicO group peptidase (beta-lactamase class C family)